MKEGYVANLNDTAAEELINANFNSAGNELYTDLVKNVVSKKLINPNFDPTDRDKNLALFEQYKLLVDSAHRGEERRGEAIQIVSF